METQWEVTMGEVVMEENQEDWRSDPALSNEGESERMELTAVLDRARVLAGHAREWIADNPFAALGIAVGTGFLVGRAMRLWVLRP
jgi:ElaB/YqjD/DUF883 family membrane-anchored ribosome-binding protein